ncbi:uncharacterized protein METZ01_LOCUS231824, partial [marine metagenome]
VTRNLSVYHYILYFLRPSHAKGLNPIPWPSRSNKQIASNLIIVQHHNVFIS